MRQNLRFHSRALVKVFLPKLIYRLSSRSCCVDGRLVDVGGAKRWTGTQCTIERGMGNLTRRSNRSLLNKAIR